MRENGYTYIPDEVVRAVEEGDSWFYRIGDQPVAFDWAETDFDADGAGWLDGPSGLGYGDEDDATDLPEMQNLALTLYARTEFEVSGADDVQYLIMRIRYDDSYVAYLNGIEVSRANLIGDPPAFDEPASDLHEITGGAGTFDESIDLTQFAEFLDEGTNVLAIEVHNASLESSDLSLSAEIDYASGSVEKPEPSEDFIRGDLDGDRRLSVSDAVAVLKGLFLGADLTCLDAADANDDDLTNVSDPLFILSFLFRGGDRPAPPFPAAGTDPDGARLGCAESPLGSGA
ncbi:MAG: hypothetical protein AAF488_13575 [Planctomycetota bacterium]